MSLAAQLAELSRPAPKPLTHDVLASDDDAARSDDDGASEASDDERAAPNRDHYETVARSQRRRAALDETGTLRSARYRGETVSARKALGGEESDEASDAEEDSEDAAEELEGDEEEDEDEADSDAAPARAPSPPSRVKSLRFADPSSSEQAADPRTLAGAAASDAALLASLRAQSADDAERGRAVRELRALWEGALAMRIRTQAFVRGAGRIRPSALQAVSELDSDARSSYAELLSTLGELEQGLFATRHSLISADEDPDLAEAYAGAAKKRKRASSADAEAAHLASVDSFLALHDATSSRACTVLDAWSVGAQAVGAKELRAVNRGAGEQVRSAMSGDGAERLIRRSRIWRGEARVGEEQQQAREQADEDPEVFDDSDFYATLLRELIESKGEGSGGDPSLGLPVRSKAPKRAVDTRASKGRRLRYEVHEKAAHFMPPVPRETWTAEQRQRLFAQLGGLRLEPTAAAAAEAKGAATALPEVDLGGLRMFG